MSINLFFFGEKSELEKVEQLLSGPGGAFDYNQVLPYFSGWQEKEHHALARTTKQDDGTDIISPQDEVRTSSLTQGKRGVPLKSLSAEWTTWGARIVALDVMGYSGGDRWPDIEQWTMQFAWGSDSPALAGDGYSEEKKVQPPHWGEFRGMPSLRYLFVSRWQPPLPVVFQIVEMFPQVGVGMFFEEPDGWGTDFDAQIPDDYEWLSVSEAEHEYYHFPNKQLADDHEEYLRGLSAEAADNDYWSLRWERRGNDFMSASADLEFE